MKHIWVSGDLIAGYAKIIPCNWGLAGGFCLVMVGAVLLGRREAGF